MRLTTPTAATPTTPILGQPKRPKMTMQTPVMLTTFCARVTYIASFVCLCARRTAEIDMLIASMKSVPPMIARNGCA